MESKRHTLLALAGAAAAAAGVQAKPLRPDAPPPPAPPPAPLKKRKAGTGGHYEHATYTIGMHRFGLAEDWTVPRVKSVEQVPLNRVFFQDTDDVVLGPDGMVHINHTGLYRVLLGTDWKAQAGLDVDRRMVGVRRKLAGDDTGPAMSDIRLGSTDTPASNTPLVARWGGMVVSATTVPPASTWSFTKKVANTYSNSAGMQPGDHASVAGIYHPTVLVTCRVVDVDTVEVTLRNLDTSQAAVVDLSAVNIMVQSHSRSCGESNDAWQVLNCPLEELQAGDRVYACVRVIIPGDYLQATDRTTFLQLERFG